MSCPKCGSEEVDALTPRTIYACGSSDYDQRPGTFKQSTSCGEKTALDSLIIAITISAFIVLFVWVIAELVR